jgi:catechol 2,3-dioxygenase-like lactoylglutathione lyase family enzyme
MLAWILVGLMVFGACAPEPDIPAPDSTSLPAPQPSPARTMPTLTTTEEVTPSPTSVGETACQSDLDQQAVRYEVHAVLDWTAFTVRVEESVTYRNDTGAVQDKLIFNVENSSVPENFELTRISDAAGLAIQGYRLENLILTVPLDEPLLPGCETALTLRFNLTVPAIVDGYNQGHLGYWGHSARQVNLGMWFPLMAAYDPAHGWITPPPHWLGEHFALRAADFGVELKVKNAPDGLIVAGPGVPSRPNDTTWRFDLAGGRELSLSISPEFQMLSTLTSSGVNVELYYFPDPDAETLNTPRYALYTAADALAFYATLLGPYPHQRMVVVQGEFPDGMEFSGLVFVSQDWFRTWHGIPNDWLTLITVHEVAHQWWYAEVGNDQGLYPYLDEALALYCEELFIEHYYPEHIQWWWDFRIAFYAPVGYVDAPIYEFYSPRGYIDAVYLRGAQMFQALRDAMGDDAFFGWLRQYVNVMKGQIAYPEDFWGALPAGVYAAVQPIRAAYLRQADIFPHVDGIP